MSAPAAADPAPGHRGPPSRPRLSVVGDAGRPPAASAPPGPQDDPVRRAMLPVLAGLVFPARRWQVLAEADAWGATGPIRHLISGLPEGCYRDLDNVVDVLRMLNGRRTRPT